jgi:hypothetical protein
MGELDRSAADPLSRYKSSPTLLHTADRAATQVRRRCYTRPAAPLQKVADAATHGRSGRYNWYNIVAPMFLANFSGKVGFATFVLYIVATILLYFCNKFSGEVSGEVVGFATIAKKKLLQFLCFFATLAYSFCYHVSGEVSGDASGEFPGDISGEFFLQALR